MAGTPRKDGGVQVKVTLRKPTLAAKVKVTLTAKPTTAPGTSGGGRANQTGNIIHTVVCEEVLNL